MQIFDSLLVEKWRPKVLKDIILNPEVSEYINNIQKIKQIPHMMLYGSPGIGKSSLAKIIVKDILDCVYLYINASNDRGIDVVRDKISNFCQTKSIDGKLKVIVLEEYDKFTADAQDALKYIIEEYSDNVRFLLTANNRNRITPAILSRMGVSFEIKPPLKDVKLRLLNIMRTEHISFKPADSDKFHKFVEKYYPDMRILLGLIQKNTKDGCLNLDNLENRGTIAVELFKKLINKEDVIDLRKYVIENEIEFNNDYFELFKGLFEVVYSSDHKLKKDLMILIGDSMYKHQFVLDKEINFYCMMLVMHKIL